MGHSHRTGLATAFAIAMVLFLGACGWHTGLIPPDNLGTVGVEVFPAVEDVRERNLEPILHAELSRVVSDLVDAPLVSVADADLVVRGHIRQYRRRGGIRDSDHQLIETGLYLAVRAELVERATGRIVRPAVDASLWSGYVLGDLEAEAKARDRVVRNIAETLVLDLFRPRRPGEPGVNPGEEGE